MFLDIGVGILLAMLTSKLFSLSLTFPLIFLGVAFTLLPDIDFLIEYANHKSVGGKEIREHRELMHCPLTYTLNFFLPWIIWGNAGLFLFLSATFAHFVHDSVGIGWGIKWLFPFSKKNYKLFSGKNGSFSRRLIVSWKPDELKAVVGEYGDPNWIRNCYPMLYWVTHSKSGFPREQSLIELLEFSVFMVSLLVLWSEICFNP